MFHLFVRPVVWRLAGKGVEVPFVVKAVAAERMFSARGRRTFVMVSLGRDESGRLFAFPVPFGLSGAISTLAKADGFVEILESQQFVSAGDEVVVRLFRWQDSGCFVLPS